MAPTTSTRPLLRVVSSLLLAITATMLSVGYAHAEAPPAVRRDIGELDTVAAAPHSTISVLLAGDHAVFRSGLRAVIGAQPDLRCVAEVADPAAALGDIRRLRPDVAIVDLDMPGLDDPTLDSVAALGGATRILTLATGETDENLYRALRLGASGFLTKSLPSRDLVSAIRTAARGEALIDPRATRRLITRLTDGIEPFPAAPELATLTAREHEVLLLIARAHTNPEIARILGVGEQTIKTHVSNVLAKLGVRDRVQAVVYAHTRRIVPRDPISVRR
ncbi:LuxR C-terminal-related transcriptional regulator [Nocardia sp. NPDC051570]|uniref:LuxR C-terminal-related transcriptional regulator n=1 Tax=Nocardia sp. NPDC051570 TaxID=3364324 RepID=UPI00379C6B0C